MNIQKYIPVVNNCTVIFKKKKLLFLSYLDLCIHVSLMNVHKIKIERSKSLKCSEIYQ